MKTKEKIHTLTNNRLCGYQEANAWFEQYKNNHIESEFKLKMECG